MKPPAGNPMQGKVIFANQLRGVAVLIVVSVHYTVVYQLMRPMLSWVVAAPQVEGPVPAFISWVFPWWLDIGAFSVSLFFLVSGFVVPFSLAGTTGGRFLLARGLRIFPTYWVALLIEWSVVYAASLYWGRPIVFDRQTFLDNALLVHSTIGVGGVDLVNWTLAIEVKFYLLAAVIRPLLLRHLVWPLLLYAAGAVALNAAQGHGLIQLPPQLVAESMYLVFVLPGTLFSYHFRGAIRTSVLVGGCLLLLALGNACWALGPFPEQFPIKTLNYAYGLAAFAAAYAARRAFRPLALLDFFADISYPLYLVHSLPGFSCMTYLILVWQVPYGIAAITAFLLSVATAWVLHVSIERVSIDAGHRLTRGTAARPVLRQARRPYSAGGTSP